MGTESPQADKPRGVRRWWFGPAVLDERTLELSVNGELVEMERKPLEVLLFLLNHAGEVVTRDELLENVWRGRVTTEQVLTQCIRKAREALADKDQALIKTVHGFGYRLVAPVRVEIDTPVAPPRFDFKPGDHPPQRPLWSLVEQLGRGGHGEVWLARHDKTREERVYKFALDDAALTSLKREITLYRVLNESFGNQASVGRILDWNLKQVPCFIESEYVAAGSLVTWAQRNGGLANVALATRLDLAAQVAEVLAAAHSVGVLHKDLKPSNVLIEVQPRGAPKVKLCDFGSGSVLDRERLEELGISKLGFTQTVNVESTSGTPLYLAPEVIAGQPHTTRSDLYSAGVLLYQLVAGDLKRTLAPGWERSVPDALLREDIAAACEGDPARRIVDAAELAKRIRTLETRRKGRAAEFPETQYAMVGDDRVGYQVSGRESPDLLFTPGFWNFLEAWGNDERVVAFHRRLTSFSRLIRFDRRGGGGVSDPATEDGGSLVEHWVQDCLAVLDASGAQRPVIAAVSSSDSGPLVLEFVKRYPARCSGLIFANTTACIAEKPDYPEGHPPQFVQHIRDLFNRSWGRPDSFLTPSLAADVDGARIARLMRQAATPRGVVEILNAGFALDSRHVLPTIRVPALVMARDRYAMLPQAQGQYLARHIPGARFVSLQGSDSALYWEHPERSLDLIEEFVTGLDRATSSSR